MKIYDYTCATCGRTEERFTDNEPPAELMCRCGGPMRRRIPAPMGKVKGRADGKDRSDADRFTADMLGISRRILKYKMDKLGISPNENRNQ